MGSVISSRPEYFPNWKDFILPTPETYGILINGFQYFPIVSFLPLLPVWSLQRLTELHKTVHTGPMAPLLPPRWQNLLEILPLQRPRPSRLVRHGNHRSPQPPLHPLLHA